MKREEDLIKTRGIPFVGGEVLHLPSAQQAWAETLEQQSPERKSSPSCQLHLVPAALRRIPPLLPTCPHRAGRISMTFSGRFPMIRSQQVRPSSLFYSGGTKRSRES